MINSATNMSLRVAAFVAGLGLMLMTIFAVVAIYVVFPKLIIPGDAIATVNNIIADEALFRAGIGSLIFVAILDILVAWALYVFFEPVNKNLSLLTAWFRLVYSTILCFALFKYIDVIHLLSGADYLKAIESEQLQANVMLLINTFDDAWSIGLVFFGLHLALLGYLILSSDYVPKLLGVVLIAAGLAYLVDNIGILLIPGYDISIATFLGWGELLLMFWLLYRGSRLQGA